MAFGDVVVLLPGISGSALVKDGRTVWGTSAGAILRTLATGADSIRSLTLTAEDDPTLDDLGDGVTATALVQDLHLIPGLWKIDGYSRTRTELVDRLGLTPGENYFELPYDWRRDNRVAARLLERRAMGWLRRWRERSGHAHAKLALVVHSMGGLVARHFLEVLGGWRETRTLVSFGTPYAGSLRALGYLAEGYGTRIGPVGIDLSGVLRSFTSVYQLLPTYRCLVMPDGSLRCVAETPGIQNVDPDRAAAAAAFHGRIAEARAANAGEAGYGYGIFPVVGIEQPTFQSARLDGGRPILDTSHPMGDFGGDGTVPRVSATPDDVRHAGREMYAADAHGSLQNAAAVLEQLYGVLTGGAIDFDAMRRREAPVTLGLALEDAYAARQPAPFRVRPSVPVPVLRARIGRADRSGGEEVLTLRPTGDGSHAGAVSLPPGAYRIRIEGGSTVSPVTDTFVVVDSGARPSAAADPAPYGFDVDASFGTPYGAEAEPYVASEAERPAVPFDDAPASLATRWLRRGRFSFDRLDALTKRRSPGLFRGDPAEAPAPSAAPSVAPAPAAPAPAAPAPAAPAQAYPAPAYPAPAYPAPSYRPPPPPMAAPAAEARPAAPEAPAPARDLEAAADEGTAILRYPAIDPIGSVLAGREIAVAVDLRTGTADPATEGGPMRFAGLAEDWASLAVGVELFSTGIDFGSGTKDIEVQRNGPSRGAVFLGRVHDDLSAGQSTEIVALFKHEGRFAGMARRSVVAGDQAVGSAQRAAAVPALRARAVASVAIERGAPAPELTVRILHLENSPDGCYYWSLAVRDPFDALPARLSGATNLGKGAEAFAAEMVRDCPTLKRGEHIDTLNGLGEQIWAKVPECFRATYWAMRAERGEGFSIQFITDDPYVPWELMRPVDAAGERAEPILALAHPVARWIAAQDGLLRNRLPAGSVVSIALRYRNPNDFLAWAQAEAKALREAGAVPVGGTVQEVMAFLKGGLPGTNVALVHFAGHGSFGAINASQIQLEDGVLRPVQVGANEVRLGVMQRPFVMLNACEVGSLTSVLGSVGGWAEVFSRRRFSGVLAPLWAVYDDDASQIAQELVDAVWRDGERIGEALRRIRASRQDRSATPFAYTLYGDVMAGVENRVNA